MKIVLYNDYKVGLLKDGKVVDVSGVVPRGRTPQLTIEGLITNFQSFKGALERVLDQGEGIPLSHVQLRAPVPRPGKIVCMGGNFGEFVGRKGVMWGFLKSPTAAPNGTRGRGPWAAFRMMTVVQCASLSRRCVRRKFMAWPCFSTARYR